MHRQCRTPHDLRDIDLPKLSRVKHAALFEYAYRIKPAKEHGHLAGQPTDTNFSRRSEPGDASTIDLNIVFLDQLR